MTGLVWLLFATSVLATLVVAMLVGWLTTRRVRAAIDEAVGSVRRLGPAIARLEHSVAVTKREMERVGAAVDDLSRARAERRARH